jgi:hypothetical protein
MSELWRPSAGRIADANLTRFMRCVNARRGTRLSNYDELYAWSLAQPEAFWREVARFADLRASWGEGAALEHPQAMPGARFFPTALLFFSLGVESGHFMFIGVVLAVIAVQNGVGDAVLDQVCIGGAADLDEGDVGDVCPALQGDRDSIPLDRGPGGNVVAEKIAKLLLDKQKIDDEALKATVEQGEFERQRDEARNLASLTGWDFDQIARKMDLAAVEAAAESGQDPKFWRKLWGDR